MYDHGNSFGIIEGVSKHFLCRTVYLDDVASEATSLNGTVKLASLKWKRNSLSNSIEYLDGMGSE